MDITQFFGGSAFTPATVEPTTDFEVLPPGKYPVLIESAEVRQTKKGTGHYIKLIMVITQEGLYKNRKLWDQINIDNPSTECVEIGMRTLSALGRALGIPAITDTSQLVNQVVIANVKVKDEQNSVRTYSAYTTQPLVAGDSLGEPGYSESSRVAAEAPVAEAPAQDAPPTQDTSPRNYTHPGQQQGSAAPTSIPPWARK